MQRLLTSLALVTLCCGTASKRKTSPVSPPEPFKQETALLADDQSVVTSQPERPEQDVSNAECPTDVVVLARWREVKAECPQCACGDISFLGPEKLREKFIGNEEEIDILCPHCGTKIKGELREHLNDK